MTWWIWIIVGFVLALAEMATPGGFFFLFFGAGAILTGLVELLWEGAPGWSQWLMFSAFSIVSLALFRKPLLRRLEVAEPHRPIDSLVGEAALALESIAPGGGGKAELRGTPWNAKNVGDSPIAKGQTCEVTGVDELTLRLVGR